MATFGGSIGGHVRHCLDHVAALLDGLDGGVVDYEARERGTAAEGDPAAAAWVAELDARLAAMGGGGGAWVERQEAFHRHRWDGRPQWSVMMSRGGARTVSTTTV